MWLCHHRFDSESLLAPEEIKTYEIRLDVQPVVNRTGQRDSFKVCTPRKDRSSERSFVFFLYSLSRRRSEIVQREKKRSGAYASSFYWLLLGEKERDGRTGAGGMTERLDDKRKG